MKKIISFLLSVTMIMGMTLSAFASLTPAPGPASNPSVLTTGIKGINESKFIDIINQNASRGLISLNDGTSDIDSASDLTDLILSPGDIIKIELTADMFLDSNGNAFSNKAPVSLSALNSAQITVRSTTSTGSGLGKISLEGNKSGSRIKIEFSKNPAADGQKFSYGSYLSYRGARKSGTRLQIKGILENSRIEVDSSMDYVDISKGLTIKAKTGVRNLEIYLGEYCTINRTLVKGREYSGIAITDILAKDESLFMKYPNLEYIYRLETVGLKANGNIVTFDLEENYYVYNTNGTYIGRSNNALPYWTKYYITSKKYDSIAVVR